MRHRTHFKTACCAAALLSAGAIAPALAAEGEAASDPVSLAESFAAIDQADEQFEFLNQYCVECHNFADWAGGVAFDTMSPQGVADDREVWEHVVRRLRGGLMPPSGSPFPEHDPRFGFIEWMESYLDHVGAQEHHVGHTSLRRLNRTEYANAVRDLLGIEVDAASLLPQDATVDGFDNIASVLTVSPALLEQSLNAARVVAEQAIGDPAPRVGGAVYNAPPGAQLTHVEGLPLGTRGGLKVDHYFPADGEYELNIANLAQRLWVSNQEFVHTVIATYDGEKIFEMDIGGGEDLRAIDQVGDPAVDIINQRLKGIRFDAEAGPHEVAVTFLHRSFAEHEGQLSPTTPGGGNNNVLRISSFEIRGPYDPTGLSPTPARNQIFTCYPEAESEKAACAEEIIAGIARRAFRGEVSDAEMAELMGLYETTEAERGFDLGIRRALTAVLASPRFLYRAEPVPEDAEAGEAFALTDHELATRLSFFLWSSVPDDELMDVADSGKLSDPKVLEAQVRRMLADPRSKALVDNFAFQWLAIPHLEEVDPDPVFFADIPGDLRDLFREELALFIDHVFREDRPVTELLTADYTYLNEDLALHYDITDVKGDRFRLVELEQPARYGLLGKGAVLMSSAYPDRTSPVLRGAYVLEHITGTPPPDPPPNVEALQENQVGQKALTVRERLVSHRANPGCFECHGIIDPLGFALENFDAVGRWREIDRFARTEIDASGVLPDGTNVGGPGELREALMDRPDQFVQAMTEKMMMYALGREVEAEDMPAVREIVHQAEAEGYHFTEVVMGVIESDQFQMKAAADPEAIEEAALH